MKKISLFIFALSTLSVANAQVVGKQFPDLSGETLEDKTVSIPKDTKGKFTLIGMAFSQKAEADLQSWVDPVYNTFINPSAIVDYSVNVFLIPMFTGAKQPTMNLAKKQMKENTEKSFYKNVLCYHGELKKYKEELQMTDKEKPYFFVIDKNGKIVYTTSGAFSEEKLDAIEDKVE